MKALAVLSCLIGVSSALGGGGCPLNYGDSCGWVEADSGEFCYKPMYHGKDLLEAISVCFNLGNPECPSQLLTVDQVPELHAHADLDDLPKYSRVDTFSYCAIPENVTCEWKDSTMLPIGMFPAGFTIVPTHPNDLPEPYDDNHLLSGVWSTGTKEILGHTPAQDRVSFICTSCVNVEHECPVICEYCIPHHPIDGVWGEWGSWSMTCPDAGCDVVMNTRSRMCMPPRYGGDMCWGQDIQEQPCPIEATCPTYSWGNWMSWTPCAFPADASSDPSAMCGPGETTRMRMCVLDGTEVQAPDMTMCGNPADVMVVDDTCMVADAPLDCDDLAPSEWCDWDYSLMEASCNATCGFCATDPPIFPTRMCSCPPDKTLYDGEDCTVDQEEDGESSVVAFKPCELEIGEWGMWTDFGSDCVNYCIQQGENEPETNLFQDRYRDCEVGKFCLGSAQDRIPCVDLAQICTTLYAVLTGVGNSLKVTALDTTLGNAPLESNCDPFPNALPTNMAVGMAASQLGLFPVFCGGMATAEAPFTPEMSCQVFQLDGTFMPITLWVPRVNSAVAQLTQTSFILVGGDINFVSVSQTTEIVSLEGGAHLGPNLPEEMHGVFRPCAISPNPDTLIVAGGMIRGIVTNMAWMYTFSTGEWLQLPSMKVKRYNHMCTRRRNAKGEIELYAILGDTGTKSAEKLIFNAEGEMEWELMTDSKYLAPNAIIGGARYVHTDFSGKMLFGSGKDLDGAELTTTTFFDPSLAADKLFLDVTANFPPEASTAQGAGCFIEDSILRLVPGCFDA